MDTGLLILASRRLICRADCYDWSHRATELCRRERRFSTKPAAPAGANHPNSFLAPWPIISIPTHDSQNQQTRVHRSPR